jgi:16S rRNA (guanine527-N7)-methyltransferase
MMNGVICLKGGNVEAEVQPYRRIVEVSDISQWFTEEWFREKNVIYLPLS